MPRNDLADAFMTTLKDGTSDLSDVARLWGREVTSAIARHARHLEDDPDIMKQCLGRGSELELMRRNAQDARDLHAKGVNQVIDMPEEVLKHVLWEPSTGTVDNLGLVQVKDFFPFEEPFSTKDINDFSLFDIPDKITKDLASQSRVIEKLQRLLGRSVRPDDSRDPFVSARHEYLVEPDDLHEQSTISQTRLFPAVIQLPKRKY